MSEGWESSRSGVRLETDGINERLRIDYALRGIDQTRKNILLRRVFTVLAIEEKRIYELTDQQAIAEFDALKASQDKQFVKKLDF